MSRPYRRFMHNNPYPKHAVPAMGYLLSILGLPCVYYGTEQGFDGGGDNDCYVRECMFGGNWDAFDTTGMHFFNEQHEIYQGIKSIAAIRAAEPALRYGMQYFRDISEDGHGFYFPTNGQCTLAFSRILDTSEVLVAMNLDTFDRQDYIIVDRTLSPPGRKMIDMLNGGRPITIQESPERAYMRVPLKDHEMAILKLKE